MDVCVGLLAGGGWCGRAGVCGGMVGRSVCACRVRAWGRRSMQLRERAFKHAKRGD